MAELVVKLVNGELAGKTMQGITKEVNAAAQALKKAEIGTQAWVDANQKLEGAKKLQGDLKKQIDGTTGASNLLKGAFLQIPGADKFNAIVGSFTQMRSGMGGLVNTSGLLKGAMMAIPIFLIITAITTLVAWFKRTEDGANTLAGIFKAMGNVFDVLISKIWNIGNTLKEFLANPIQFFKSMGNDIANAAKEGYKMVQVLDDIEDRQRDMEVKAKEADILVDQLLLQAKNIGNTYEKRIELLNKADALTRSSYKEQLSLSKEYLDAIQEEINSELKRQGVTNMTDEQAERLKTAKLAYLNLLGQETQTEEKIANRREQIIGKQEKTQEKLDAAKDKQVQKDAAALEQSLKQLEDLRVQAIKDSEEQEIAAIDLKFQRMLEQSTLEGEQRKELEKLIEETKGQEIQAIRDKYAASAVATKTKEENEKTAKAKKEADDRAALDKKSADFDKSLSDAKLTLMATTFGAAAQLLGEDEKARKKNADLIRAFTIGEIIANTQREISGYYTTVDSVSTLGITGSIKAAIALIRAGLAIERVSSQKFAMGGIPDGVLRGPSHAQGGIPLEAEGHEIILTKGVYSSPGLRSMASAINVAGGGRSFAAGGPSNPFDSSRGPISSGRAGGGASFDPISELKNAILAQTAAINRRIDRIQVVNNLQDTEKGLKTLNTLRTEADV